MTHVETKNLTSYDFLKCAALILMIVDHIGYFFYPDDMWWRAVGRMSAPIWLFLIGYALSRDLPWQMWAGTLFLAGVNYGVGADILPIYIIGSMLLFRMVLDPVMEHIKRNPKSLYPLTAVLFALTVLSGQVLEYGTAGFVIVMAGYICRKKLEMGFDRDRLYTFLVVAAIVHFSAVYLFFFGSRFSPEQYIFTGAGLVALMLGLSFFKPVEYPALSAKMLTPFRVFVQLCGRWSLEIYVIHLAAFHFIAAYQGDARFP